MAHHAARHDVRPLSGMKVHVKEEETPGRRGGMADL